MAPNRWLYLVDCFLCNLLSELLLLQEMSEFSEERDSLNGILKSMDGAVSKIASNEYRARLPIARTTPGCILISFSYIGFLW